MSEGHFEAKVHAERKSKDGIFLTLLIHPNDYSPELAALHCGASLQVGWAEIVDTSVQKMEVSADEKRARAEVLHQAKEAEEAIKPRRKFSGLSLPQQAGIRAEEGKFRLFLSAMKLAHLPDQIDTANYIRAFCGINSRSELATDHDAANKWRKLNSDYEAWLLDQKYPEQVR